EFLNGLTKYWRDEQANISNEIGRLNQNIELIKNIISSQQELSKTTEFDQVISVNDLLNEALLISGLNLRSEIKVEKNYGKIKTINADKIKLLQVLVNIIHNAR